MRIPVAIAAVTVAVTVAVTSLAKPVQADACSDYRLALAAREAAHQLFNERQAAGFVGGTPEKETLLQLLDETEDRRDEAQRAVRATLSDQAAASTIDSLLDVKASNGKAWDAMADWVGAPSGVIEQPLTYLFDITIAIQDAREWVFNEVCRHSLRPAGSAQR